MTPLEERNLRKKSILLHGLADIRLVTLGDGPGVGGRLIEMRTPSGLAMDVALDRGGDILRLSYMGREIGWHSANDAVTHAPIPDIEGGLGFLRGFDGFLVTCGLDHHGPATETSAKDMLYPLRTRNAHPLHGRITGNKCEILAKEIDWQGDRIHLRTCVRQTSVFGEALELERELSLSLSKPSVHLSDRVTNLGFRPTRHGILYHFNIGYPMLNKNARLVGKDWALRDRLDDGSAIPSNDHVEIVDVGPSPQANSTSACVIGIENPDIGARLKIEFHSGQLPKTALWRAFQSGIFALGLEPQTEFNSEAILGAQEQKCYDLRLEIEDF